MTWGAVAYAVAYAVAIVTRIGGDTLTLEDVGFLPLYLLAAVGSWHGSQRPTLSARERVGWRSVALAWGVSFVGAVALLLGGGAAVDRLGTVLYKLYFPCLLVGFLLLVNPAAVRGSRERTLRSIVEVMIVAVAAVTLSWYFVWGQPHALGWSWLGSADEGITSLGEVAVLVAAGMALISSSSTGGGRALDVIGVGAFAASIGDLMLVRAWVASDVPLRQSGAMVLAASAVLFTIGGLSTEPRERAGARSVASYLPYIAISTVGVLVVVELLRHRTISVALQGAVVGAALLTALVIVRLVLTEREARSQGSALLAEAAERERLERELRQAHKLDALGLLAGGVAHDFNNLLQAIRGNAELARRLYQGDMADELRQILAATDRGASLCRQLLLFGRPQPGERTRFALANAVNDLLPMLRRVVPTSIALTFEARVPQATVLADRSQVEVALLNLVMNARDAIAAEGRIQIAIDAVAPGGADERPMVQLTVRDTGRGMSPESLARAFEPFYTTKGLAGTGLGLSMVYGTMRALGGDVLLHSTEGEGTEVSLRFPVVPDDPSIVPCDTLAPVEAPRAARIVLVEDEPAVRTVVQRTLGLAGYRVLVAEDGVEGLALLEREGWEAELLVSDINMPRLNGVSLALRVRARRPDLPIILMTGYAPPDVEEERLPAGVHVLAKPFELDELVALVRRLLA